MRKTAIPAFLCLLLVAPCGKAEPVTPMKPGLWQVTMTSDSLKALPKISPAQAAQMRKMGIEVPEMSNDGMTTKVCYTQAMLSQNSVPGLQNNECKMQSLKQSGEAFSAETACDGPTMKGSGTASGIMTPTRFEVQSTFNGTLGGQAIAQHSQVRGTFISDNCGTLKPLGTP